MFPLTALLDIGGKLVDKFFPDPAQAEAAKLKLLEMQQNGDLVTYTVFGLMSAWDVEVNKEYVQLLGQWGMLIMSFYFGGRTLEKIMGVKK
jgi:hypothetical protein